MIKGLSGSMYLFTTGRFCPVCQEKKKKKKFFCNVKTIDSSEIKIQNIAKAKYFKGFSALLNPENKASLITIWVYQTVCTTVLYSLVQFSS